MKGTCRVCSIRIDNSDHVCSECEEKGHKNVATRTTSTLAELKAEMCRTANALAEATVEVERCEALVEIVKQDKVWALSAFRIAQGAYNVALAAQKETSK